MNLNKESIKNTKDEKLKNKAKKIQKNNPVDKNLVFKYIPFFENEILLFQQTEKRVLILLKNGRVFCFFPYEKDNFLNGNDLKNFLIPKILNFRTKIIDLACGDDHCLALGINGSVFSWGSNSQGQLGLPDVYVTNDSRKDEPSEIYNDLLYKNNKIIRVFASKNSSFAISENQYLYGWGLVKFLRFKIIRFRLKLKRILPLSLKL